MPIVPTDTPLYTLTCDNDDCGYLADIDGDSRVYFETPDEARGWALGNSWAEAIGNASRLLCHNCAVEQAEEARRQSDLDHHNAEIHAAIQHTIDTL
ncbi:hypothetical protein [Streptomyces subrutilus]|uniref:hypothetical protein n=1 Tax=Streptomyces subrutilus TaxID=36818 RepID=UPI002E125106|nr:hypothetical protein OG479_32785 [Streptomyces subrutilus]